MQTRNLVALVTVVAGFIGLAVWMAGPPEALAHCDTMDGPVVTQARQALAAGDVTPVLKWVQPEQEGELRAAFEKALAVRSAGPEAKELADMYFFETLVRVHRAGEGAPFTGLKPAGQIEPPVAAADQAIATGSVDELARRVAQAAASGVRERFARVIETKKHAGDSVDAGRAYVAAYVEFVHYVEALHNTIGGHGAHHADAAPTQAAEHAH